MNLKKNKLAVAVSISLLATSLAPMGAFAAEDEFVDEVVFEVPDVQENSEEVFSCGVEDADDLLFEEIGAVEAEEAVAEEVVEEAVLGEVSKNGLSDDTVSNDGVSKNGVSKNEVSGTSTVDSVNGNPVLSDTDSKAMAEAYIKQAVALNDKSGESVVATKGSVGDTGSILQYYSKGKVKKLTVSDNGLSACDVTVNAKVKLTLKGQFEVSGNSLAAEGKFSLPANAKMPKTKYDGSETTVSLKAIKGAYKYKISFVDKTAGKTVTVHVENLAFHKTIKKTGVFSRAVSGNDISGNKAVGRDTFVIRPTLLNIENGAGVLNGVWMVDKEIINRVGKENAVKSKKNGATCYIDEKSGCLVVTAPTQKGNAKIVYHLNGKKYSTAVKAGGTDPKASLQSMRDTYAKYNLLYVTPEK